MQISSKKGLDSPTAIGKNNKAAESAKAYQQQKSKNAQPQ